MVDFVTQNGPIFHKIFKMFVVINQKLCSVVSMGREHHRYYKHTKARQNPRVDPKFLVDWTRNYPYLMYE